MNREYTGRANSQDLLTFHKLAIVAVPLFAVSMWLYVQRVMIAHQAAEAAAHGIPRGNLSDLYPRWLGARELLLHHRDPYSAEITREIQIGYYGRPIDPSRRYDPEDQQAFAYPVYVVFLLAPTIALPFAIVQTMARWLLVGLTAASVPLWLRALRWRISPAAIAALVVLTLGSFPAIQGIKLQQLSLLENGLIAICAAMLVEGQLATAGVLLALASMKPQLILLLSGWLLLWAISDWQVRKNFVWNFLGTMAALVAGGELILPGWIGRFRQAVIAYRAYNNGAHSNLELMLTVTWGRAAAILLVLGLALMCWRSRRASSRDPEFGWPTAVILAATVLIAPKPAPYNQLLLLAPVLLIARHLQPAWRKSLLLRMVLAASAAVFAWPWLAATAMAISSLFLPAAELQKLWAVPIYTSPAIPLFVFVSAVLVFRETDAVRKRFSAQGTS